MLDARDDATGRRTTQLSPEERKSEARVVLQLARWMAETGQGARADITGALKTLTALG